jgi:hypothetical protein
MREGYLFHIEWHDGDADTALFGNCPEVVKVKVKVRVKVRVRGRVIVKVRLRLRLRVWRVKFEYKG